MFWCFTKKITDPFWVSLLEILLLKMSSLINFQKRVNSLYLKFNFVKSQKYFFHFLFAVIFIYFLNELLWGGGDEVIISDGGRDGFRRYLIPNFSSDVMETASWEFENCPAEHQLRINPSPIQNGNYLEINFLTYRFSVGNLRKINQNQKTSWDCKSCFTPSIYMK